MKKRRITIVICIFGGALAVLILFIAISWVVEWRPIPQEVVYQRDENDVAAALLPDTLTVLTWNIGYGGLGAGMDFFVDGGKQTRTSCEKTEENLAEIGRFLVDSNADIILLQEVDRNSRRTYGIDQFALLQDRLQENNAYYALNYNSLFVPVPLRAPLGRVASGVAVFSRIRPEQVVRYQYDSRFSFPVRLFNLKRCWLALHFKSMQGNDVWISGTHNTAYDTGGMRTMEMEQLYNWLSDKSLTITGGDWNQNPPGYIPSAVELEDPHFSLQSIPQNPDFQYISDSSTPTVRYLYEPLTENTTKSVIDFFVLSKGFKCLKVKTIDLGFQNSDHNPVRMRVTTRKD